MQLHFNVAKIIIRILQVQYLCKTTYVKYANMEGFADIQICDNATTLIKAENSPLIDSKILSSMCICHIVQNTQIIGHTSIAIIHLRKCKWSLSIFC